MRARKFLTLSKNICLLSEYTLKRSTGHLPITTVWGQSTTHGLLQTWSRLSGMDFSDLEILQYSASGIEQRRPGYPKRGDIAVLHLSPPCQSLSMANRTASLETVEADLYPLLDDVSLTICLLFLFTYSKPWNTDFAHWCKIWDYCLIIAWWRNWSICLYRQRIVVQKSCLIEHRRQVKVF